MGSRYFFRFLRFFRNRITALTPPRGEKADDTGTGSSCGRRRDRRNPGRHLPADRPEFVDLLAEVLRALGAVSRVRCRTADRGMNLVRDGK